MYQLREPGSEDARANRDGKITACWDTPIIMDIFEIPCFCILVHHDGNLIKIAQLLCVWGGGNTGANCPGVELGICFVCLFGSKRRPVAIGLDCCSYSHHNSNNNDAGGQKQAQKNLKFDPHKPPKQRRCMHAHGSQSAPPTPLSGASVSGRRSLCGPGGGPMKIRSSEGRPPLLGAVGERGRGSGSERVEGGGGTAYGRTMGGEQAGPGNRMHRRGMVWPWQSPWVFTVPWSSRILAAGDERRRRGVPLLPREGSILPPILGRTGTLSLRCGPKPHHPPSEWNPLSPTALHRYRYPYRCINGPRFVFRREPGVGIAGGGKANGLLVREILLRGSRRGRREEGTEKRGMRGTGAISSTPRQIENGGGADAAAKTRTKNTHKPQTQKNIQGLIKTHKNDSSGATHDPSYHKKPCDSGTLDLTRSL